MVDETQIEQKFDRFLRKRFLLVVGLGFMLVALLTIYAVWNANLTLNSWDRSETGLGTLYFLTASVVYAVFFISMLWKTRQISK